MAQGTIVVVGAGTGLGLAIGRRFGREGMRVALLARTQENLDAMAYTLTAEGIEARGFAVDVHDHDDLARTLAEIERDFGPVEVLEYSPEPHTPPKDLRAWMPASMTLQEVQNRMSLSCYGAVTAAQAVLPAMLARSSGTILITTTGSGIDPIKTLCAVGMSMAAARNFAISLNEELRGKGVYAANVTLSLLIEEGDPYGDPAILAEQYWALHANRQLADCNIATPADCHQHHRDDMAKYGIEMPVE